MLIVYSNRKTKITVPHGSAYTYNIFPYMKKLVQELFDQNISSQIALHRETHRLGIELILYM
jgi:galactose-1-phosphate uridylyltransferase